MAKRISNKSVGVVTALAIGATIAVHDSVAMQPKLSYEDFNDDAWISLLTPKTIFATSEKYTGNLVYEAQQLGADEEDSLAAADYICNYHAKAAGLKGKFVALLSTSSINANARITPSLGPYRLVTGTPVAENFAALFSTDDGSSSDPPLPPVVLISPVYRDEYGMDLHSPAHSSEPTAVWTGSNPLGEVPSRREGGNYDVVYPNVSTCFDWTTNSAPPTGECDDEMTDSNCGMTGNVEASFTGWLYLERLGCNTPHYLYCAER